MIYRALILFCFISLGFAPSGFCQEPEPQNEARVGPERESPRITLVLDVSGSMAEGGKLEEAIGSALSIAIAPTDDMEVGVIVFQSVADRLTCDVVWGIQSPWFRFPSEDVANALRESLNSLVASGGTNPSDALQQAYSDRTQAIVLITDGAFNEGENPVLTVLTEQERLRLNGSWVPPLIIMAIQANESSLTRLRDLAEQTGGQLWEPSIEDDER